jgi:formamidopyrimidine-DNA glycosylase
MQQHGQYRRAGLSVLAQKHKTAVNCQPAWSFASFTTAGGICSPAVPELPEVEVLVRHLRPLLANKRIRAVHVRRPKVLVHTSPAALKRALRGAVFADISRRGKYLVFELRNARTAASFTLLGHLGMSGRMYLLPAAAPLPKHAAVVLDCGPEQFVFEDTRYFGRFTLDMGALARLGPEPLGAEFGAKHLARALQRSQQALKVKLLDQSVVAGVGNIYASEALFRAGLPPTQPGRELNQAQVARLWRALRKVLRDAIAWGSTVPLDYAGTGARDGLFYYGRGARAPGNYYEERLRVYDREGQPCPRCGAPIQRVVQAARSTFFCPRCQRGSRATSPYPPSRSTQGKLSGCSIRSRSKSTSNSGQYRCG